MDVFSQLLALFCAVDSNKKNSAIEFRAIANACMHAHWICIKEFETCLRIR